MPAKDKINAAVKNALQKDGWTITDDPYPIKYADVVLQADFAAEATVAAERGDQRIAVEVKSFLSSSKYHEFEQAVGQYIVYRTLMEVTAPERELFLAVDSAIYRVFLSDFE